MDQKLEEWPVSGRPSCLQQRLDLRRLEVHRLLGATLGRLTAATGFRARCPSLTAASPTARATVYACRTVDADKPLCRSWRIHRSTEEGFTLFSGRRPRSDPTMWLRVMLE